MLSTDYIKDEIKQENLISVEADKTIDVSCKSQMTTILHYLLHNDVITEHFLQYT